MILLIGLIAMTAFILLMFFLNKETDKLSTVFVPEEEEPAIIPSFSVPPSSAVTKDKTTFTVHYDPLSEYETPRPVTPIQKLEKVKKYVREKDKKRTKPKTKKKGFKASTDRMRNKKKRKR